MVKVRVRVRVRVRARPNPSDREYDYRVEGSVVIGQGSVVASTPF